MAYCNYAMPGSVIVILAMIVPQHRPRPRSAANYVCFIDVIFFYHRSIMADINKSSESVTYKYVVVAWQKIDGELFESVQVECLPTHKNWFEVAGKESWWYCPVHG